MLYALDEINSNSKILPNITLGAMILDTCRSESVIKIGKGSPFLISAHFFGHCPNSNYSPPPHSNGHSGALFSGAILTFYHFYHFFYHFL